MLKNLQEGAVLSGVIPGQHVTIVQVKFHGSKVAELTFRDQTGAVSQKLVYEEDLPKLEIVEKGLPWSFNASGEKLRLASEAYRINLAYLFDPLVAVHSSLIDPLPHQITAVYQEMLIRQPLRYLLADDPGAGKTIMAGLLIKELIVRGDLKRCLVCAPGSLVDQWQDELWQKFHIEFSIISRQTIEDSKSGNPFAEKDLVIGRLDHMSRNEEIQEKLLQTDWDLIICDEAHKMSASFFGGEIKETKRHKLGKLLSTITRHFLLMTATPHNGKEEDFQLFMSLLDGDRFEGKFRDGVHQVDTSDLMRRMVKEDLLKFDGTALFPERRSYTSNYKLSVKEAELYRLVTDYVREEFNRADALDNDKRKGNIGFALTILQRRLASSPEAIYKSLMRRRERLEKRLREEKLLKRGGDSMLSQSTQGLLIDYDLDEEDIEDSTAEEIETIEEQVVDRASAARTIAELEIEISILKKLEQKALEVRRSGTDTKWEELSRILGDKESMIDSYGNRRKLVIFTEHRDTLSYLLERISIGNPEAVVTIHGGMGREERKKAQTSFTQDKDVVILLATDAAGEGINLQRSHLMVNYDLPWNPNRLEQRFGRIHRIGQTEVCHLWNLVAGETREGDVLLRLLKKLEVEKEALGGGVFDVLGQIFQGTELRKLLIKAIRYGESPEVRGKFTEVIDETLDRERLRELLEGRALTNNTMDVQTVYNIREDMERADARRLQPHYVASFFLEAFQLLGGKIRERESKRYEITHVPAEIRSRDRQIGVGAPVLNRYERVTFYKSMRNVPGQPQADLLTPGHPLLDSTIDIILERYRDLLKCGTVLVDPEDSGEEIRFLFYLESVIQDARKSKSGSPIVASKRLHFVEMMENGDTVSAGYAPYLDYRPVDEHERASIEQELESRWLQRDHETLAVSYAIEKLVPEHVKEIRERKEQFVDKALKAVKERLTKEINYWDHRAEQLKQRELSGQSPKVNSAKARSRADELQVRLRNRLSELERERQLNALPPNVVGGALVVPIGLINKLSGHKDGVPPQHAKETKEVELRAMRAVMKAELALGYQPHDVSASKCGYDIESRTGKEGRLRFIEVKGRVAGAKTVTVTRNEILCALNKPDSFILAVGIVNGDKTDLKYIRNPFDQEPGFAVTSVNYNLNSLLEKGVPPN